MANDTARARLGNAAAEAKRLWGERNLDALVSEGARTLNAGTTTDWGLPASARGPAHEVISLAGGIPDPETLPRTELLEATQRLLASDDTAVLTYGGALGFESLREQLAKRSTDELGLLAGPEHFMLTNGSAGGIAAICDALLDPGDVVITEAPTFSGTMRTFRGHLAEIMTVPTDTEGLDTDALAEVLAQLESHGRRAKLIYSISNFHNPTGATLSVERREVLVRLAAEHGAFVLDDDAYGDIYFDEERLPTLAAIAGGHGVVTIGTFSKTIATGLRVGWVQAPPTLIEHLARVRFDMGNSPLLHHMLSEFIASGSYATHVARMRPLYARKAATLQRALIDYAEPYASFRAPRGGFFLWVELRDGLTAEAVQRAASEEGVAFPVGHAFFPDRRDHGGEHIRLAYSTASLDALEECGRRIAIACERAADSPPHPEAHT